MRCNYCGAECPENTKFCPNCGAQLEQTVQQAAPQPQQPVYQQPDNSQQFQQLPYQQTTPLAGTAATEKPKKKVGCLTIGLIVLGVFVLLGIIGAIIGGGNKDTAQDVDSSVSSFTFDEKETETSTETTVETTTETTTEATTAVLSGIRPEFKKEMDDYEAFFDEYVAFMEKYSNSDNTAELMADYAKFMAKYAEMSKSMEAMKDEEMTDEETAYYLEVTARIYAKLAKVAD